MPSVQHIRLSYNNVYVLESDGGRLLVDTGPDYDGAWASLEAALGGPPDTVLATHAHYDHAGLGARWQRAGVPVAMGEADASVPRTPTLADQAELAQFEGYVEATGAPPEVVREVAGGLRSRHHELSRAWTPDQPYGDGGRTGRWPTALRYEPFVPEASLAGPRTALAGAMVVSCPGHTPGNLVAVYEPEGWLFSGDQLLPGITPTPAIQSHQPPCAEDWRFRSLPAFTASMKELAAMRFTRCVPGHGEPFDDVADAIALNLKTIEERTERVLRSLRERGPSTVYALGEALYPRALQRRFWQIIPTVIGHLDLLEAQGLAFDADGIWTAR
jgi:glyoxylase-like metal-dependent hydrolase (beta-lactamase superfamily II)